MARFAYEDGAVVVIIGSGAGGGTLAHELTRRGIKVVLLEAGKRESPASFVQNPGQAFGMLTWNDARSQSGDWTVARDFPTLPAWHCKTLGGTTVHWTAASLRLQSWELKARSHYGPVAGARLIDWPVPYKELEHYYDLAEKRMFVARRHGNPGMPASNNFKVFYNGAKKIGYKRVHTNYLAINNRAQDGRSICLQQGFCVQGCKVAAKWSTLYTEIPRAEATGKLDLRIQSHATRIEHGADGRVNAVVYRDAEGGEQRQKARIVCVAGNAIETARLLLLSESARFPQGLANSSGNVGRHYLHHTLGFVWGVFDKPVHMYRGATLAGLVEDEVVHDTRRGFVGGYHLELVALDLPTFPLVGMPYGWGRKFSNTIENYRNIAGLLVSGEDMPRSGNRITLDPERKDQWGLPIPHVHVDEHDNDRALRRHGQQRAKALYEAAGAREVIFGPAPPATHNMGTCRMSADPRDGVCNGHGQTHDVPNLFVSDGSQFSSAGSANPTLTIVALALRQAEYIAAQMRQRVL